MEKYKIWKLLLVIIAFIALGLSIYSLIYSIKFGESADIFRRIFQVIIIIAYIAYYFYQRKKSKQNS